MQGREQSGHPLIGGGPYGEEPTQPQENRVRARHGDRSEQVLAGKAEFKDIHAHNRDGLRRGAEKWPTTAEDPKPHAALGRAYADCDRASPVGSDDRRDDLLMPRDDMQHLEDQTEQDPHAGRTDA